MSFESYNANSSGSSGKIASLSLFKSFIKIRDILGRMLSDEIRSFIISHDKKSRVG